MDAVDAAVDALCYEAASDAIDAMRLEALAASDAIDAGHLEEAELEAKLEVKKTPAVMIGENKRRSKGKMQKEVMHMHNRLGTRLGLGWWPGTSASATYSKEYMLCAVRLPLQPDQVTELADAVTAGLANARLVGGPGKIRFGAKHACSLSWPWPACPGKTIVALGYTRYTNTHAGALKEHSEVEQVKHTAVLHAVDLVFYASVLPHLPQVLDFCLALSPFNSRVAFVHILDQTSPHGRFGMHRDNAEAMSAHVLLSFVFLLTDTASSMRIAHGVEFTYQGPGSGAAFSAGFWHESLNAEEGTLKIAVFVLEPGKSPPALSEARIVFHPDLDLTL
jgi:hypothetical protein